MSDERYEVVWPNGDYAVCADEDDMIQAATEDPDVAEVVWRDGQPQEWLAGDTTDA